MLEQTPLGERDDAVPRHDEVVERADVDQRERLLERRGQKLVRARGLRDAARMVVREDDAGRVVRERRLDDFARVDAGLRERAAKELARGDQPILAVEEQRRRTLRTAAAPA